MTKQLTVRRAQAEVRQLGFSLRSNVWGEFEVYPFRNRTEAYFTNDLHDAVLTARQMAAERFLAVESAYRNDTAYQAAA